MQDTGKTAFDDPMTPKVGAHEIKTDAAKDENQYKEYFEHNHVIVEVLSLFSGFLFTAITISLTFLQNRGAVFAQGTILFLGVVFYFALYVLLDNLEMGFHYIHNIPPLTLKVRPFLSLLVVFYLFGTATVMMFLLFDLLYLAAISAVIWTIFVIASINSTVKRFYKQSIKRTWLKEKTL